MVLVLLITKYISILAIRYKMNILIIQRADPVVVVVEGDVSWGSEHREVE